MKRMKYVTGAVRENAPSKLELKNKELALRVAEESIVLLKNENNALPIQVGPIALYGAGAIMTTKGGTGSGEVNERHAVNIIEGLEKAGFTVTTKNWLSRFEQDYKNSYDAYAERKAKTSILQFKDVINIMNDPMVIPPGPVVTDDDMKQSNTNTAIYVVVRQSGEGTDKKLDKMEFDLTENEKQSIKKIASFYEKTILVINSGSQMNLEVLDEAKVDAVIYFAQQGQEGGTALANILTGRVNPSGKLADTWAVNYTDIPFANEFSYLNGNTRSAFYKEGIYVGYRYFDTFSVKPRFPFGFGLSYTTFEISALGVSTEDENVTISVKVRNSGNRSGKEVVEAYVCLPSGRLDKEKKRLVAFDKTSLLGSGEEQTLSLNFSVRDCTSYDQKDASYILEKGEYLVCVGSSSADVKAVAVLVNDKTQVVRKCHNLCVSDSQITELVAPLREQEVYDSSILRLSMPKVKTENIGYEKSEKQEGSQVKGVLDTLSVKEMALLCTGSGYQSMMKAGYVSALGCIGKTTDKLVKKGILGVNLSDGPAGLRLSQGSAVTKKCQVKNEKFTMSFMEFFPSFLKKRMLADPKKDELLYQFCTAFPVGTALAQTWNSSLLEQVGFAIGQEMEEYLVTYWLAPAMNIHRNPLCGRNFEYFSEDPLVSGKAASAIVRGVQAHKGCYACIKHFVANNQEEERNKSNSIMDERTLREIYLKGFEIAVKESHPASVMSSYNKLNGVYTSNSEELLCNILRCEWGFDGVVMTDWYATGNGLAENATAIKVGNDLIMPGMSRNTKEILNGIKSGSLTVDELRLSASRVLKQILESNVASKFSPDMFE